jgi:hypothetical protein
MQQLHNLQRKTRQKPRQKLRQKKKNKIDIGLCHIRKIRPINSNGIKEGNNYEKNING